MNDLYNNNDDVINSYTFIQVDFNDVQQNGLPLVLIKQLDNNVEKLRGM